MKVDVATLDPRAVAELRGIVVFRATRWGIVAQSWPGKARKPASKLVQQYRTRFGLAAKMAATPFPVDYETAVEMSKGTEQVPRDILTMAALGNYYELVNPDGTEWGHVEGPVVIQQPQEISKMWQWSLWDAAWTGTANTTAAAAKGLVIRPLNTYTVTRVRSVLSTVQGASYTAAICLLSSSRVIQNVVESAEVTATLQQPTILTWELEATLTAGQIYAVLIVRKDANDTTSLTINVQTTPRWLLPVTSLGLGILASKTPTVGQTVPAGITSVPPIGLLIPNSE